MKEITIKVSSFKREFVIWGVLLVVAFLTNIYAISTHGGQWSELVSQLHIVLILSIVYYGFFALIRAIVYGIILVVKRMVLPA